MLNNENIKKFRMSFRCSTHDRTKINEIIEKNNLNSKSEAIRYSINNCL